MRRWRSSGAKQPDVALVDYQMPDMDGLAVVRAMKRDGMPSRVLLLSALTDSAIVFQALEEGAAGYLAKDSSRSEIVEAVVRVAKGEVVVPPALTAGLVEQIRLRSQPDGLVLSEREQQIVQGFAVVCRFPNWPRSCSSARARSRPTLSASTRSWASPTAPPRWPRPCDAVCWSSRVDGPGDHGVVRVPDEGGPPG